MNFEPPRGVSRVTLGLHPERYLTKLFLASKTPSITTTFDRLSGMLTVTKKTLVFEKQIFDITNVLQRARSHSRTHSHSDLCVSILMDSCQSNCDLYLQFNNVSVRIIN
jgi:hypothetical protein